MNNIFEGIKRIDSLIKNAATEQEAITDLLSFLKKYLKANIVIVGDNGQILYKSFIVANTIFDKSLENGNQYVEEIFNEQLLQFNEPQYNLSFKGLLLKSVAKTDITKYVCAITPVSAISQRLGTLIIYKDNGRFGRMDIAVIEYVLNMISLILKSINCVIGENNKRALSTVKSAIDTLSYSELDAVLNIFTRLDGKEGMIVASKIADEAGITRSVIVNALRKLESAGIIESRSMGMKGTFIKVNNSYLFDEISKLKG